MLDLLVDGTRISDEIGMARAAFSHFARVLGPPAPRTVTLDLTTISHRPFDLSTLEQPFTPEEIWEAIKRLPSGKALGPDGFTAEFLRAC